MPIPEPKDNEGKNEFIERCLEWMNENNEGESQEERQGICYSQWEERNDSMNKELRVDQAEIKDWRYDEDNEVLTANVLMTKSQVLPYKDSGETVHELLPPEELSRDSWLDSIKSKSVTNLHPEEEINYQNIGDHSKGSLHNDVWTEQDGDTVEVWTTETIYDEDLIQDIRDGKKEQVSIGRYVNVVDESGEFGGAKYDKKQTDFELNHLAHVPQGRAGQDVKVRLDGDMLKLETEESGETNSDKENTTDSRQEGINMKLTIGEQELALDEELEEENVESFQGEIDERLHELRDKDNKLGDKDDKVEELQDKLEDREDEATSKEKEIGKLEGRIDSLEEKMEKDDVEDKIDQKLALVDKVREVVPGYNWRGKSIKEIKVDLAEAVFDGVDLGEKSDAYIDGRYDAAMERLEEDEGRTITMKPDGDDGETSKVDELRKERIEKFQG